MGAKGDLTLLHLGRLPVSVSQSPKVGGKYSCACDGGKHAAGQRLFELTYSISAGINEKFQWIALGWKPGGF